MSFLTPVAKTTISIAVASSATAALAVTALDEAAINIFGAPAIVIVFGFVGAFIAAAYSQTVTPRAKIPLLVVANALVGVVAAEGLHLIPGLAWIEPLPDQVVSAVAAFLSLWFLPLLIKKIPELFDRITQKGGGPNA